jgi:hypothetical protein
MKPILLRTLTTFAALTALASMACVSAAAAQTHLFVGGGPTGTSDFGFSGGWGAVLGMERRIAPAASFLLRAEGSAVPATAETSFGPIVFEGASFGESGPDSRDATLLSLAAGLRLGGAGRFGPYLDALVGLGYFNDPANTGGPSPLPWSRAHPSASETNVALSFGSGLAFRPAHVPGFFADVHYEFYFSQGADTPVIPVRVGLILP